jgi:hypothetical protein
MSMTGDQSNDQGRPERLPWVALGIVAAMAVVAVTAYVVSERLDDDVRAARRRKPALRGTACVGIGRIGDALESGDRREVKEAIQEAEALAFRALDKGGIRFGEPERLALAMAIDLGSPSDKLSSRVESKLVRAEQACADLRDEA